MKKRLAKVWLVLVGVIFFLAGCVSDEERAQAEGWRKQAEKNAIEYIAEKYGIEAQVIGSESQTADDMFRVRYTSKTLVTMEHEGKQFSVLSFGEDEKMEQATDNFQKEELVAALKEELKSVFGEEPDELLVNGGDNKEFANTDKKEFYDMFFREYYDGSNLKDVLTETNFYCVAEYVNDVDLFSLYEKNKTSLFDSKYVQAAFITYDSQENMENSVISTYESENAIYTNAVYVEDALLVEDGKAKPITLSVGQCEDFYYLNVGADLSKYSIQKGVEKYAASDWNGHGFSNAVFATDQAYYLEGDTAYKLYIYIPQEKYELISEAGNVVAASRFYSERDEDIGYDLWHEKQDIPGYVVMSTSYADREDFSFRFMYNDKTENK